MNVVVLGSNGQLGRSLIASMPDGVHVTGLDLPDVDITNRRSVSRAFRELRPAVIVNAAAYTAVDQAESDADTAHLVNAVGARITAEEACNLRAKYWYVSTDFVFDGRKSEPYSPGDAPGPLSVYGSSKLKGEEAVLDATQGEACVIRTAWLYSRFGKNFVKTMLNLMAEREELRIINDQTGTPTWATSLAQALWKGVQEGRATGIHHYTDFGRATWFEFAVAIYRTARKLGQLRSETKLIPVASNEYQTDAVRPRFSVLDCSGTYEALGIVAERWQHNLELMLMEFDAND